MAILPSSNWSWVVKRRAASREFRQARRLPVTKPPKLSPDRQEQLWRLAATRERCATWAAAFGPVMGSVKLRGGDLRD